MFVSYFPRRFIVESNFNSLYCNFLRKSIYIGLYIKVNSQTIINEKEIASKLNNYFTDIGKHLADKIDTSNKHPFNHYLHSPSISKFHFKQTNPNEIISVINNLPMKTSSGHEKYRA